jgi:hypothetical protein
MQIDGDVVEKMLSLTTWSWVWKGQSTPNTKWTIDQAWGHGPFASAVDTKRPTLLASVVKDFAAL